jgi:5-methylcytosine-specific restriction protein A
MKRKEFPKSVKVAALKRATRDGVIYCEECGGQAKAPEIDHINPDGLTGEPVLENAKVLCRACHKEKTASDKGKIAKAKRREAAHLGVKNTPKKKIESAPMEAAAPQKKASKPPEKGGRLESLQALPRRPLFR